MSEGYDGLPAYYLQSSDPLTPNLGLSLKGCDPIVAENFVIVDSAIGGGGFSPHFNTLGVGADSVPGLINGPAVAYAVVFNYPTIYAGLGTPAAYSALDVAPAPFTTVPASGSNCGITVGVIGESNSEVFGVVAEALIPQTYSGNLVLVEAGYFQSDHWGTGTIGEMVGASAFSNNSGAGTVTDNRGLAVEATNRGSGTVHNNWTIQANASHTGPGATTNSNIAIYAQSGNGASPGGLTVNDYTIFIDSPLNGGTFTSPHVGLYIADQTTIPGSYAIQVAKGRVDLGSSGVLIDGSSSGIVTINTQSAAGTWTFTLPTSGGTSGFLLRTDGSGVSTWVAPPALSPGESNLSIQYNNGGILAGSFAEVNLAGTISIPSGQAVNWGALQTTPMFVQSKGATHTIGGSNIVVTPDAAITTGNQVLVFVQESAADATVAVTDSASNTYTKISGPDTNATTRFWLFSSNPISGSPTTVTVTTGSNYRMAVVVEITSQASSSVDQFVFTAVSGSTWTSSSITTTIGNELLAALGGTENGARDFSAGTGYTLGVSNRDNVNGQSSFSEYKTISTIGTYTASVSLSASAVQGGMYLISIKGITQSLDAGISRLGAASLAIGNGTSGDFSGALKLTGINLVGTLTDGTGAVGTSGQVLSSTVTGTKWVAGGGGGSGTVTSVAMTGDGVIFNSTITGSPITTSGTLVPVLLTQTANTVLAGPTTGSAATPTFRAIVAADIPSGTVVWNSIGNATGALTLANGTNATTFQQTAATIWLWDNTTVATSGTTNSTPLLELAARYWTGAASASDTWSIGSALAAGTNGASTLTIGHAGSTGKATVKVANTLIVTGASAGSANVLEVHAPNANPFVAAFFNDTVSSSTPFVQYYGDGSGNFIMSNGSSSHNLYFATSAYNGTDLGVIGGNVSVKNVLQIGGSSDLGLSHLGAASLAIGNGTASDTTGNLSFNKVIKYAGVSTVSAGVPSEIATVDLTAQSAAIAATTLYAVPAAGAGLYRVSVYAKITTAASVSSVLGGTNGFQLTWTDPTDSTTPTVGIVDLSSSALNANSTTTVYLASATIAAKASTNIQYAFDYTSAGTAMQYKLSIKVEALL